MGLSFQLIGFVFVHSVKVQFLFNFNFRGEKILVYQNVSVGKSY
jgi:hypothetical protein